MEIDSKLITRINELANLKKTKGLTHDQEQEQAKLRQEYLVLFRGNMTAVMENVEVLNELVIAKILITEEILQVLNDDDRILRIKLQNHEYIITYNIKQIDPPTIHKLIKNHR